MELEKPTQKNLLNRITFSARVLIVGLILSVTFFLLLVNSFKTYRSEISILVSAKSEVAAKQQSQIVSNIIELPKTLAFYDRMLKFNPDVRDVTVGLSTQQRKAKWNEMLSVERASFDSSVIKIGITTSRQSDADQLASKTVRTLFDTSALYYNIKKDVDLRIIDGPISRVQVSNWYWLLALGIILGFAVSGLLEYLIFGSQKLSISKPNFLKMNSFFDFKKTPELPLEEELESLNNLYRSEQTKQPFVFEQKTEDTELPQEKAALISDYAEKFQEIKKITKKLEPGKYPNFPEMPIGHKREASAPDNLPIADSAFLAQFETPQQPAEPEPLSTTEEETVTEGPKEPTPEELKKRLNELLKGKI